MSTFIYGLLELVGKIIICGSIARERILGYLTGVRCQVSGMARISCHPCGSGFPAAISDFRGWKAAPTIKVRSSVAKRSAAGFAM